MPRIEASEIAQNLWMGSMPPAGHTARMAGIDILVLTSLDAEYPYPASPEAFPGVDIGRIRLDDGVLTPKQALSAMRLSVALAQAIKRGKRVLITCSQGRNRSGLITGMTLSQLTGCSGRRAIQVVRERRKSPFGEALTNQHYTAALACIPQKAQRGILTERAARDARV